MEENRDDQLLSEIGDDLGKKLTLESTSEHFNDDDEEDDVVYVFNSGDDDDDEDEEGEFEFSFAGVEVKSPESAEVLFENGQIRPSFPFIVENSEETSEKFGPPVKKLFVVPPSTAEDGEWRAGESPAEVAEMATAGSSSPEFRRKSNSTGFSRFWRMKELLARSNSDGKDRFVFMPSSKEGSGGVEKEKTKMKSMMKVVSLRRIKVGKKNENNETRPTNGGGGGGGDKEGKKKGKKAASMSAAYEAFYGKKSGSGGGGSGSGEKSSYLPYRVGFFTNASGMTRNVHPY